MKELICIVCPRGCRLQVDETKNYAVSGNGCEKGESYGKAELLHPVRTLTSTVICTGGRYPRLPVKTHCPISKEKLAEVMAYLNTITVHAPIATGDIIVKNILNTGADLVATRDM